MFRYLIGLLPTISFTSDPDELGIRRAFSYLSRLFWLFNVLLLLWAISVAATPRIFAGADDQSFWHVFRIGIPDFLWAISDALLLASAASVVGGFLGFLFGIPKTLQHSSQGGTATPLAGGTGQGLAPARVEQNTNLEQISDWLTKILVGVGLTQIRQIAASFSSLLGYLSGHGFPTDRGGLVVAPLVIASYSIVGFLIGYLLTRMFLAREFNRIDGALQNPVSVVRTATIDLQSPSGPTLSKEQEKAAKVIVAWPLDALKTADDIVAWAKSQVFFKNYDLAKKAYEKLWAFADTAALRRDYAQVLLRAGDADEAARQIEIAKGRIDDSTSKLAEKNISHDEILVLLYEDPPGGFTKAIAALSQRDDLQYSAVLQVYMAAAYGQKNRYDKEVGKAAEETLRDDRQRALDAVSLALRLDKGAKILLQLLWNPKHPDKKRDPSLAEENDLECFKDDPDFVALLRDA